MKYFVIFSACSILVCSIGTGVIAQDKSNDAVVYVVELDDQAIQRIKSGLPVDLSVPPHIRDKISVVRVRYKVTEPNGGGVAEPPAPRRTNNGFSADQQTSPNSALYDGQYSGSSASFNQNPTRFDSNVARPADSLLPPRQTDQASGGERSVLQPTTSGGFFRNDPATPNAAAQNYGLQPVTPNTHQYSNDSSGGRWNPPAQPSRMEPISPQGSFQHNGAPNPNTIHPSAPITNPAENYFRNAPSNTTRPLEGSEFDTRYDPRGGNPYVGYNAIPQMAFNNQQAPDQLEAPSGYRPFGPTAAPTATPFSMPRQASLVAGFHHPDFRNQNEPPAVNRTNYPQRNSMQEDIGEGGAPAAFINGNVNSVNGQRRTPSNVSSTDRINGVLWFMLFCSVGLNFYLAWISRGFYVRYRELADELRETFATTV